MKQYHQLTEFLVRLIKVQIEKYAGLAIMGVGPDAGINAGLVVHQVDDLIKFANTLIGLIKEGKEDDEVLKDILSQTKFYLETEFTRGYAGWLLDKNDIHQIEYNRLIKCRDDLKSIVDENNIEGIPDAKPKNEKQQQCEHDSHSIAFKITKFVIDLKANPEMEITDPDWNDEKKYLNVNLKEDGRYNNEEIYQEIVRVCEESKNFLSQSTMDTSTERLTKVACTPLVKNHKEQLEKLKLEYQDCNRDSVLFSENPGWYECIKKQQTRPQSGNKAVSECPFSRVNNALLTTHGLFNKQTAVMVCAAAIAFAFIIYNLAWKSEEPTYTFPHG